MAKCNKCRYYRLFLKFNTSSTCRKCERILKKELRKEKEKKKVVNEQEVKAEYIVNF